MNAQITAKLAELEAINKELDRLTQLYGDMTKQKEINLYVMGMLDYFFPPVWV